ncbi:ATP-binding protein [Knoellia sp. CPCC 206435]|uniref:ATP-binding protein n=1 Tax=Knoellia terrae TaxID=3404797 RepID=UPI003B43A5B7
MASTARWSCATTLPSDPTSASVARAFVREHLVEHDLSHLVDDMVLAASELATNAIQHARTPFDVELSRANGLVRIVVTDSSASTVTRRAPDDLDESGRGLMIVELVSHEWGTDTDRHGLSSVWASFLESPASTGSPVNV